MITEAVRLLADVLDDGTHGVAAQLAAMQTGGYVMAGDTLPTGVVIGDATRDALPAVGRNMDANLAISVFLADTLPYEATGEVEFLSGTLVLAARVDATSSAPPINTTDIGYIVRAISRSVRWWFRNLNPDANAYQTRNGVQLIGGLYVRPSVFAATADTPTQTFGVAVAAQFRDVLPDEV